jgi:phenylalanine-4-hydroxylase
MRASINTSYDITRPQPQLFVAKDFSELTQALDEFANTMAFRQGGAYGLRIGVEAQNTVTAVLDSGIQITGILKDPIFTSQGDPAGFILSGTKQFSYPDRAIDEVVTSTIPDEILIPLFEPATAQISSESITRKLEGPGLEALTGLRVYGRVKSVVSRGDPKRVFLLENARITDPAGRILMTEPRRLYPLVVGTRITSVFGGAADRKAFVLRNRKTEAKRVTSHKSNLTPENAPLNKLYQNVRAFRENKGNDPLFLGAVLDALDASFPEDWLLRLELLELYLPLDPKHPNVAKLRAELHALKAKNPNLEEMIERGLALL